MPIGGSAGSAFLAKGQPALLHRDRRAHRPLGVVGPGDRRPPEGDDGVADELVDRAAMAEHDVAHLVEIGVEQVRKLLRRDRVAELGEALEIGEQGEDLGALAMQRQPLRIAHDLGGDVRGEIFAERALRELALLRADRARRRADADESEQPARAPAEGRQAERVHVEILEQEGDAADQRELHDERRAKPPAAIEQAGQRAAGDGEQGGEPQAPRREPAVGMRPSSCWSSIWAWTSRPLVQPRPKRVIGVSKSSRSLMSPPIRM